MHDHSIKRWTTAVLLLGWLVALPALASVRGDQPQGTSVASPAGVAASVSAAPADDAPTAPQTEAEQALRKRVEARWDAVLAMDFDRVYEFATPAYRQAYGKTHFFNKYGGQIKRTRIKILRVEFVDEARTQAVVHLDVYYQLSPDFGSPVETTSYNKGAWVEVDGEWWRVEPR